MSRLQEVIKKTTEAMEKLRVREAIHNIVYVLDQDIVKYQKMKEVLNKGDLAAKAAVLRQALNIKVRLLAPFTPYICEELWQKLGGKGFVCFAQWPKCEESKIDPAALASVELVDTLLEDTQNIIRATGIKPKRVVYYTAAAWKRRAYLKALEQKVGAGLNLRVLIKEVMQSEPNIDPRKVADFAKKVVDDLTSTPLDIARKRFTVGLLDENLVLKEFSNYLAKELSAEVSVFSEDDPSKYDPKNRAELAKPYRPAIYIE
jgi:leucyl-tRNA synthetase